MGYGSYSGSSGRLTERALREEFVRIGQLMHMRNYVTATDGNLSARLDADRFLVTPSGLSKGYMTPDQMVVIDWDAKPIGESRYGAARNLKPSSEILLHLEAYRQRPDIQAVVHAHPTTRHHALHRRRLAGALPAARGDRHPRPDPHHRVCHARQRRRCGGHPRSHPAARRHHPAAPWQRDRGRAPCGKRI